MQAASISKEPRLALALALAREAGTYTIDHAAGVLATWKRPGERLTPVDLAVQSKMMKDVAVSFPRDGVLAEEDDLAFGVDREFVWVLDPLDGTNNYALGIPCFSVSVGVLRAGAPHLGVVHDPNTGFTAWAVAGLGAYAGDRKLNLPGGSLTTASNVCVRVPMDPDLEPIAIEWMRRFKFRGFGSVALQLAYVATGGIDVFLDHRAALWDVAAGAALVLEAGGRITEPRGAEIFPVDLRQYRGGPVPFLAGTVLSHSAAVAMCRAARSSTNEQRTPHPRSTPCTSES